MAEPFRACRRAFEYEYEHDFRKCAVRAVEVPHKFLTQMRRQKGSVNNS
jgi:hypothetical protein